MVQLAELVQQIVLIVQVRLIALLATLLSITIMECATLHALLLEPHSIMVYVFHAQQTALHALIHILVLHAIQDISLVMHNAILTLLHALKTS